MSSTQVVEGYLGAMGRVFTRGLFVACLFGLASCSGGDGKTVLRVAKWGALADDSEYSLALGRAYKEFEAAHPGVEVQIETIPNSAEYFRKLLLGHIAGSVPDVVTVDASSAHTLLSKGVLMRLDGGATRGSGIKPGDYFENVSAAFSFDGGQYAVPLDFTPMVVYYNKDLFDAAGVAYPEPGWSWSDFRAKAKALSGEGRYGFKVVSWMPGWVMWLWNNGGGVFEARVDGGEQRLAIDSSPNREAVGFLTGLVLGDKSAPSLSHGAASGIDPFANGECAMEVNGHWAMVGYRSAKGIRLDRIGVVPLPRNGGGPSSTVFYAAGLGVGGTTKHKDLALAFVRHMTSYKVQKSLNVTGIAVCARKDVAAEAAKSDPREQAFLRIVPSAVPPTGSYAEGYDFVETEGDKMMSSVLNNGVGVGEALRRMSENVRRYRERE